MEGLMACTGLAMEPSVLAPTFDARVCGHEVDGKEHRRRWANEAECLGPRLDTGAIGEVGVLPRNGAVRCVVWLVKGSLNSECEYRFLQVMPTRLASIRPALSVNSTRLGSAAPSMVTVPTVRAIISVTFGISPARPAREHRDLGTWHLARTRLWAGASPMMVGVSGLMVDSPHFAIVIELHANGIKSKTAVVLVSASFTSRAIGGSTLQNALFVETAFAVDARLNAHAYPSVGERLRSGEPTRRPLREVRRRWRHEGRLGAGCLQGGQAECVKRSDDMLTERSGSGYAA